MPVWACVTAAVLSMPGVAAAQRQPFLQGVAELVEASEGIYGDEGSQIGRALDTMSRALDVWEPESAKVDGRGLLEEAARGLPLLPLAAYRQGFEQLAKGEFRAAIEEFRRAASMDPLVTGARGAVGVARRAFAALKEAVWLTRDRFSRSQAPSTAHRRRAASWGWSTGRSPNSTGASSSSRPRSG